MILAGIDISGNPEISTDKSINQILDKLEQKYIRMSKTKKMQNKIISTLYFDHKQNQVLYCACANSKNKVV